MLKQDIKILLAVVGIAAIVGGYFYPKFAFVGGAPTGSTYGTQKQASIVFAPATGSATSTSILNTDSTDRMVTIVQNVCGGVGTSQTAYTGAGLASLTLKAATTTTSAPAIVSNTNLVESIVISTSTSDFVMASSTSSGLVGTSAASLGSLRWPTNTYLTFFTNATNTAICTVGVQYVNN
jgi:hypothetical protein